MRFLLKHGKSAFAPLSCLNLTKRTIDKRQKVREGGGRERGGGEGGRKGGGGGGGRESESCGALVAQPHKAFH